MEQQVEMDMVLAILREQIGTQAQEIAILKALLAKQQGATENADL